jgi:DNA mismatch repair protein MSH5
MPPSRPPYKRRKSGSHHPTHSKRTSSASSTHSTARSTLTGTSRRSSGSSLQGHRRWRASRDISERSTSSVGARIYTGVTASVADDVFRAPADDYQDIEMLSEVIMAVNLTDRGAIGCAYYVAQTETLYFMEDVQMGDADIVDSCKSGAIVD